MKKKISTLLALLTLWAAVITTTSTTSAQEKGGGGGGTDTSASIGALTAEKIWDPQSRLIVPRSRVPFIQIQITSGTTEPLQYLRLDRLGNVEFVKVLKRIVAIDGFSRVIASVEGVTLFAEPVFLYFRDTILQAGEPLLITIAGDAKEGTAFQSEAGKSIGLKIGEVRTGNTTNPTSTLYSTDLVGATHLVNAALQIGAILNLKRSGLSFNATVGKERYLGAMRVNTSSVENLRALPSFRVHGNRASEIGNLQLGVAVGESVRWVGLYRTALAPDSRSASFEVNEPVTLPKGGADFFFKGDIGSGFASGGTVAISTTPFEWRENFGEQFSYTIPIEGFGTVVGPTITVKSPRLDVSVETPPYSWVGADQANLTVLTVVLDARESSEDIRVTRLPFWFITAPQLRADVVRTGFFDGSVDLPSTETLHAGNSSDWVSAWSEAYADAVLVPKGFVKRLQLKIDLGPTASGYYGFGILDTSNLRATGAETGFSPFINLQPGWHIIRASQGKG